MMFSLFISITISFVAFVWLRTNAFIDFGGWILKFNNIAYVKDYLLESNIVRSNMPYSLWLYTNHTNFLTKLLSCPLCFTFWANFICVLYIFDFKMWLYNAFWSFLGFLILDRLYNK